MKTRKVERMLAHKFGFEKTETHHHVYKLWLDGHLAARTYISHGERELSRFHIAKMAKQMRLTKGQFEDAAACPLSQEAYFHLLRTQMDERDS